MLFRGVVGRKESRPTHAHSRSHNAVFRRWSECDQHPPTRCSLRHPPPSPPRGRIPVHLPHAPPASKGEQSFGECMRVHVLVSLVLICVCIDEIYRDRIAYNNGIFISMISFILFIAHCVCQPARVNQKTHARLTQTGLSLETDSVCWLPSCQLKAGGLNRFQVLSRDREAAHASRLCLTTARCRSARLCR